jgi:Fe2+ transport system protein FeoA
MRSLSQLEPGQTGIVDHLELPEEIKGKLLEMGLCPGEKVTFVRLSPFGDPIELELLGYRLALRRSEADRIFIA